MKNHTAMTVSNNAHHYREFLCVIVRRSNIHEYVNTNSAKVLFTATRNADTSHACSMLFFYFIFVVKLSRITMIMRLHAVTMK